MAILDKKSLDMLNNNPQCAFTDLPVPTQSKLWKIFRTASNQINELKELIGEDKCKEWEEQAKKENEDYYSLDFFRDSGKDKVVLRELLKNIYANFIISNNSFFLTKELTGQINKETLYNIADILQSVTFFCIDSNYPGENVQDILSEFYDIDGEISQGVKELYEANKMSLKLDFIINKLSAQKKK